MALLLEEIDRRLEELFQRVADGADAPPATRLRLEGLLEAAVLVGEDSRTGLQTRMDAIHERIFRRSLSRVLGEQWREDHPFPQIPVFAQRAPVSPTTAD